MEYRSKSKNRLLKNCCQIYFKKTLPCTHLLTFVDQHVKKKKKIPCELSENFIAAIVIKESFCVSAWFCRSSILPLYFLFQERIKCFFFLLFKTNKIKNFKINPYRANLFTGFHASTSLQSVSNYVTMSLEWCLHKYFT